MAIYLYKKHLKEIFYEDHIVIILIHLGSLKIDFDTFF